MRARWRGDGAQWALLVLLGLAVALRIAFGAAYRPAFLGYSDTYIYVDRAGHDLFANTFHPAGYSTFLRALHVVHDALPFTVAVQHVLGVATALVLYLAVRRIGGPAWVALVPAAIVLLGGDQVFLEHAILSEALFTPVLAAALYAAVRCMDSGGLAWPAAAGALAAGAAAVRYSAIALVPLFAVWLLVVPGTELRRRILRSVTAAAAAALLVLGYLVVAHAETGTWSPTPDGPLNLYGRASSFADCERFDPPEGTDGLCIRSPAEQRQGPRWYIFVGGPVVDRYGSPFGMPRSVVGRAGRFARSAMLHQPLDWMSVAAGDFGAYVDPDRKRDRTGRSPAAYATALSAPEFTAAALPGVERYYSATRVVEHSGRLEALRDYESATRLGGVVMALLLVLAALAPLVARSRMRTGALVVAGTAFVVMAVPVVSLDYDARYGVPAYGPLAAAAAIAVCGIAARVRARRM